jgi:hypothetical protein
MGFSRGNGLARWVGFLALALALGVAGCGHSSKASVAGKVYYKDTPLKGGNVTFVAPDKQSYLAEIQEDGSYSIDKLPPGEMKIAVETASLRPPNAFVLKNKPPADTGGAYHPPDYEARAKRFVQIPDLYSNPDQSGLSYTVKGGKQEHDIKLPD